MALAPEQLQFVQRQLNYHFGDISHLILCFKAAHRSDIDNVADDGNRGLAKTGVKLMGLVEKRCSSELGTQPYGKMEGCVQEIDKANTRKITLIQGRIGQTAKVGAQPHAIISALLPLLP